MRHIQVKLILLAFCMAPVAYAVGHGRGFSAGIESVDNEAFDAYTHFAKQMKVEKHHAKTATNDVFAKAGF